VSCSPKTESGTWLIKWRLGWTAHRRRKISTTCAINRGVVIRTSIAPWDFWDIVQPPLLVQHGIRVPVKPASREHPDPIIDFFQWLRKVENVLGLNVVRRKDGRICAGCSVTLRYSKYPGWSSNTINLSKVSLGRVSKALVSAPGPEKRGRQYINGAIEQLPHLEKPR
jgi:hypothetical protein